MQRTESILSHALLCSFDIRNILPNMHWLLVHDMRMKLLLNYKFQVLVLIGWLTRALIKFILAVFYLLTTNKCHSSSVQ
jgi:hypothetical protein